MIKLELYIDDKKADMFDDVSVIINDSIRKAQDVGSMFTAYTQQFKLPASKQNNKIFKHFDRFEVQGGFDGRRKHSALIKLNGADYQKGYIKLNEVERKDNMAHSYSVQFFGEMTTLKDQFSEDTLQDLPYLSRFNHEFNITEVRGGFETSLKYNSSTGEMDIHTDTTGEIVYPLISHTRGFTFSTTDGFYDLIQTSTVTSNDRLDYIDLKPAVKLREIIKAIEDKYNLTFGGEFIDTDEFSQLYMWCHTSKGGIVTDDPTTNVNQYEGTIRDLTRNSFTPSSADDPALLIDVYDQDDGLGNNDDWDKYINAGCTEYPVEGADQTDILTYQIGDDFGQHTYYTGTVTITPTGGFTADYNFFLFSEISNQTWVQEYNQNGTQSFNFTIETRGQAFDAQLHNLQFKITSTTLDAFNIDIDITAKRDSLCTSELTRVWNYDKDVSAAELITEARIPFNMPKMKVIDFMRSLFKTFNLVAYARKLNAYNADVELIIEPLDDYYDNGAARDITRYVDITSSTVERVTPFKTLKFEYPEPSTFIAKKSNELSRFEFGNLTYNQDNWGAGAESLLFDGGEYKVESGFEKMQYERIEDTDDSTLSEIMYGWFVNDFRNLTPEPEIGKPLIFFLRNRTCATDTIEWEDATSSTVYNCAQNVSADETQTLNFGADNDEFTLEVNEESLFKTYYFDYITGIYDLTARKYRVNAYLPPEFIFNYGLNDKLVINKTPFNIETMSINLLTGKAQLDLLRIVGYNDVYNITTGLCYATRGYVEDSYWCREFTSLS